MLQVNADKHQASLLTVFSAVHARLLSNCACKYRVPASAVSIEVDGAYQAMTKTVDNYWLADSSTYTFPTSLQLTSVLGDTVTDIVNVASPTGAVVGAAQFPLSSSYDVVGGNVTQSPTMHAADSCPFLWGLNSRSWDTLPCCYTHTSPRQH